MNAREQLLERVKESAARGALLLDELLPGWYEHIARRRKDAE